MPVAHPSRQMGWAQAMREGGARNRGRIIITRISVKAMGENKSEVDHQDSRGGRRNTGV